MLEGAGLLLPKGATIVTAVKRGGVEEAFKADGGPVLPGLPVAVLVNDKTASGGEMLDGVGLLFDIEVEMDEAASPRTPSSASP